MDSLPLRNLKKHHLSGIPKSWLSGGQAYGVNLFFGESDKIFYFYNYYIVVILLRHIKFIFIILLFHKHLFINFHFKINVKTQIYIHHIILTEKIFTLGYL
mgnify:CR=1 FL=1|jgi:hypothetical protein